MLLRNDTLKGIKSGAITLVFRRWKRPTVKTGGTLKTRQGVVAILKVSPARGRISLQDARRAGYPTVEALTRQLDQREGDLYRIEVGWAGEDPRLSLRQDTALEPEVIEKVRRWPWARPILELIEANPAVLALELATRMGREKLPFKADVRKLKALGLTESLKIGYRLSPRGEALLRRLRSGS